jgi:hypothetical protein
MKKIIISFAAVVLSLSMVQAIYAQTITKNDSTANTVRLNSLQYKKEALQKEIKAQDAKRNKQISGVSAETLEEMNEKQDSLCLALRSELMDVILEIKELSPNVTSTQLASQYNTLVNRPDSVASAPSRPSKPIRRINSIIKK